MPPRCGARASHRGDGELEASDIMHDVATGVRGATAPEEALLEGKWPCLVDVSMLITADVRFGWISPLMRGTIPEFEESLASSLLPGERRSSCERVLRTAVRAEDEAEQRATTVRSAARSTAVAESC